MQGYSKNQRCVPPKVSEEKRNFKDGRNVRKVKMRIASISELLLIQKVWILAYI